MKKYSIVYLIIAVSILSCKKNGESQIEKNIVQKDLPSFETLFNFFTSEKTSGKFSVNTSTSLGATDLDKFFQVNINGVFLDKETQQPQRGQSSFFNNIEVEARSEVTYNKDLNWEIGKNLFGTELKLKLSRAAYALPSPGGVPDTVSNFNGGYSPKVFVCTNSFPDNAVDGSFNYVSGTKLKPAYKFDWNKDTLNKNGVFVYIEYDPKDPSNAQFLSAYPTRISNAIIVNDIGTYTLASDLFTGFPLNSRLRVYIGRGNFQFIVQTDGTKTDMQLSVLTYQHGEFFYKN
jgi:hypothetical protein